MKRKVVAVVLAGGIGKRFWPVRARKSMIQFLGKSLLVHNLYRLKKTGITEVIVVTHPSDEQRVASIRVPNLSISTVVQPQANGMAGAVLAAAARIGGRACLIMNAEDLVEEVLYENLAGCIGGDAMVLVGRKTRTHVPAGYFVMKGTNAVGLIEKPPQGREPSDIIKLVFDYIVDSGGFIALLHAIKRDRDDVYECAISELLKKTRAHLVAYEGYWYPLKYPWHVLDIMGALLTEAKPHTGAHVDIARNVVVEGPVWIGDNVKISEHTKIVGPCYIGNGTVIGNNNLIRNTHIGANCVTGFNTDITRSYIGDHCWFHSNYVGDSVLEHNVSLGSGAVLANLRLDEGEVSSVVSGERIRTGRTKLGAVIGADVRIGVNTSIMPGVKIGAGSFISAGLVVARDIAEERFYTGGREFHVVRNRARATIRTP